MKNCNKGIKATCGDLKNYAICTQYEGTLSENTELDIDDCLSVEEVIEDQNLQLDDLYNHINLSSLGENCLSYVQEDGKNIVKNVLLKYEEEICDLKERMLTLETTDLCDRDITQCADLSGLVGQCDTPIITIGDFIQFVTDFIND